MPPSDLDPKSKYYQDLVHTCSCHGYRSTFLLRTSCWVSGRLDDSPLLLGQDRLQDLSWWSQVGEFGKSFVCFAGVESTRSTVLTMQTVKHAAATAKEKVSNTAAKIEEKLDKSKASAHEKVH